MIQKKVPDRLCIACGTMKPKKLLVRVVKSKDGVIAVDPGGRANGRGAYICRDAACYQKAKKERRLERSLKAQMPEVIWETLKVLPGIGSDNEE